MRMLIRRASANSNIIDSSISELAEYEQSGDGTGETLHMLQSMFKSETSQFKERLSTVSQWFQQWSDCEQTIALCTLLKHLDSRQARFIEQLLQDLSSNDPNLEDVERQANNLDFVRSLDSGTFTQEELIQQLLKHFPLLHPGNDDVKNEYLRVIPQAFSNSVASGTKVEDCRKLLTYTLVHPAVSTEERSKFTKWLAELERLYSAKISQTQKTHSNIQSLSSYAEQIRINSNRSTPPSSSGVSKDPCITVTDCMFTDVEVANHHLPLHATSSAPPQGSVMHHHNNHRKLSRTKSHATQSSLTRKGSGTEFDGGPSAGHWRSPLASAADASKWMLPSQDNASPVHSDHGPLSPQSSLSSTDSDHEGGKTGVFYQDNSGMKEFPSWLKSLRLHKYSHLFENVSYEDMLQVDAQWLEERQVTKGARNKLAQSVAKLRERAAELRAMEGNVVQGINLKQTLTDLKAIVHTPIKPYFPPEGACTASAPGTFPLADSDLPGLINKLTGKLCTQLLVNTRVEDECYPLYIQLIDKCLHHEAFTVKQRKLLQEWRSQVVQRNGRMITGRQELRPIAHRPTSRTNSWNQVRQAHGAKGPAVYAQRAIHGQSHWSNGGGYDKKPLGPTYSGPDHLSVPSHSHLTKSTPVTKSAIHRTQSAPIRAHPAVIRSRNVPATEPEINERLDSLARSMTEAALSSQDSVEHDDGDKELTSN